MRDIHWCQRDQIAILIAGPGIARLGLVAQGGVPRFAPLIWFWCIEAWVVMEVGSDKS